MAGGFPPQGRADREGDAWRVSGHFRFGSGIRHADFVACTVIEFDGGRPAHGRRDPADANLRRAARRGPRHRQLGRLRTPGRPAAATIISTTSSCPTSSASCRARSSPGAAQGVFGIPMVSLAGAPHVGFALGVGKRAIEEVAAHAGWRQRLASPYAARPARRLPTGLRPRAHRRLRPPAPWSSSPSPRSRAPIEARSGVTIAERADAYAATVNAYEVRPRRQRTRRFAPRAPARSFVRIACSAPCAISRSAPSISWPAKRTGSASDATGSASTGR